MADGGTEIKNLRWLKEKYFERHGSRTGLFRRRKVRQTKGSRTKCGYCWLVTRPSNDMSRSNAKRKCTSAEMLPACEPSRFFKVGFKADRKVRFAFDLDMSLDGRVTSQQ